YAGLPVFEHPSLTNTVVRIPRPDGVKVFKCVLQRSESYWKPYVWVSSPTPEECLNLLKRTLIRHNQEELPLQELLRVLFMFKTEGRRDVIEFKFAEPFQPLDLSRCSYKILYRAYRLKNQDLFWLETQSIVLQSEAVLFHGLLKPLKLWR